MNSMIRKTSGGEKNYKKLAIFVLVVVLVLVAGLAVWQFTQLSTAGSPAANTQSETPQERWAAQDIDNYRFDLTIGCFCLYEMVRPVTIVVENGAVASITYIDDGTAANPEWFNGFATIDQLFERLADLEAQDPVKFDVTYDEALGIPLSADVDVSELMADEELWLTISNFEAQP